MKCCQPYIVHHSEFQHSEYPCGHCLACRQLRARDWAQRIKFELEDNKKAGDFITLTYDDNLSSGYQGILLQKSDLQKFFKRIRHEAVVKYYACGEYGEKHGRAHFHALILRDAAQTINYQQKWPYGSVHVGVVTDSSIAYCTGYLLKANAIPSWVPKRTKEENYEPFHVWSQGIGDAFMEHKTFLEMAREGTIPRRWRALADPAELPPETYKNPKDGIKGWERYGLRQSQRAYAERAAATRK